jgi:hypothetical protein
MFQFPTHPLYSDSQVAIALMQQSLKLSRCLHLLELDRTTHARGIDESRTARTGNRRETRLC